MAIKYQPPLYPAQELAIYCRLHYMEQTLEFIDQTVNLTKWDKQITLNLYAKLTKELRETLAIIKTYETMLTTRGSKPC